MGLSLHLTESKNQLVGRNLTDSKEVNRLRNPVVGNRESQQALSRWWHDRLLHLLLMRR